MNLAALAGARRHTSAAFACSSSADDIWSSSRASASGGAPQVSSCSHGPGLPVAATGGQLQQSLLAQPRIRSKDKRRRQKEEAERVEKLRLLVSYLRNGSSQDMCLKPVALEADEIELAERYKLHLNLCDECLGDHQEQLASTGSARAQAGHGAALAHHDHDKSALEHSGLYQAASASQLGAGHHLRARSTNSLASSMRSTRSPDSGSLATRPSTNLQQADSEASQPGIVINFRRPTSTASPRQLGANAEHKPLGSQTQHPLESPQFLTPNSFNHFNHLLANKLTNSSSSPSIATSLGEEQHQLHLCGRPQMLLRASASINNGSPSHHHHHHHLAGRHHHFGGSSGCSRTSTTSTSTTSATSCALNNPNSHLHNNSVGATPARSWSSDLFLSSTPAASHTAKPASAQQATPLYLPLNHNQEPSFFLAGSAPTTTTTATTSTNLSNRSGSPPPPTTPQCGQQQVQLPPRSASTKSVGAWTNPQNLATWIDNEVNSLVYDLELTTSQLSKEEKQSKANSGVGCAKLRWFSSGSNSRRSSSEAHST